MNPSNHIYIYITLLVVSASTHIMTGCGSTRTFESDGAAGHGGSSATSSATTGTSIATATGTDTGTGGMASTSSSATGGGGHGGATGGGSGGGSGGGGGSAPAKPLYVVSIDHKAIPSVLLKIDVETGVGKVACTLPSSVDAVNYHSSTFSRNGTLFASNANDASIDKIDPCTCAVTPLGLTGFGGIPGITANKNNGLYGIEVTQDVLLDINIMTGTGTVIGPLGVDFGSTGATWSDALNGGQGGLYGINGNTNKLYTINHLTGAATAIADITGVSFITSVGLEMHPANGVIYACTTDAILYSIDAVSGVATKIGTGMGHVSLCNNLAAPWTTVACLDAL